MTTQITTLPPAERAAVALDFDALKAEVSKQALQYADITAIENKAGRDQVHAAAMTLKGRRIEIQKRAKEVREDAVQFQKAVIAKGEELAAIIETEEKRLIALRDDWNAEREAEKQAAIAKEAMRRKHIEEMIDAIRNTVFVSPRETSASIEAIIAATESLDVSEAIYEEFAPAAARAKAEALESLRETLDLAKFNEADQAAMTTETTQDAPIDAQPRPAVAGQVERSVRHPVPKREMVLYHATTPKKVQHYHASGRIIAPVRGFTTLQAAMAWAIKTGRSVVLAVQGEDCHKLPDHHNAFGEAWWIDHDVSAWKCVFSPKDA